MAARDLSPPREVDSADEAPAAFRAKNVLSAIWASERMLGIDLSITFKGEYRPAKRSALTFPPTQSRSVSAVDAFLAMPIFECWSA